MRKLLLAVSLILTTLAAAGWSEPAPTGAWVVRLDVVRDPDLSPETICLTLREDGRFEWRTIMVRGSEAPGEVTRGAYRVDGDRITLEPDGDPHGEASERLVLAGGQLRLRASDADREGPVLVFVPAPACPADPAEGAER